jgi:hypothetical protein
MTANELADELDKMIPALPLTVLIKSATMLRQQAKEIEALGKAFEGERKYARYLSKLCIDNKIPKVKITLFIVYVLIYP